MSGHDAGSDPEAAGSVPPPPKMPTQHRRTADRGEALVALKAFVHSLGVEDTADTESELLLQAAPFMSESLDDNLKNAWSPEERARLDAQPMPQQLDHTNRDHEYFFFKQMRKSLERRASRSSSCSHSTHRGSAEVSALQSQQGSLDTSNHSHQASPVLESGGSLSSGEELSNPWMRRAEHRRRNLQAVWGEEGRAVLAALDSLPEDVGLEGIGTPQKISGCSDERAGQRVASAEQHGHQHEPDQQQQQQQKQKDRRFWCF